MSQELIAYMNIKLLQDTCALSDVLQYKKAKNLFADFLRQEFADEALLFVDAVEEFVALPEGEMQARAEELVDQYISDTAETQVNIPHRMVAEGHHSEYDQPYDHHRSRCILFS